MVKFIDHAKKTGVVKLNSEITDLKKAMAYLLDTHLFPQEDIDLNTLVLLWPENIGPIFDKNEELTAEVRGSNESALFSAKEKVIVELDKIQKRIDEFSDYGELEMMKQYVDDVKSVQKRITEVEKQISWIINVNSRFFISKINFN